jgi:pyruvate kinase
MKKTKIIATMGPACSDKNILREMFLAGTNVCRLNFSHGNHKFHKETINTIRELNEETGLNVAILADLQGPKIRIGKMKNGGMELIEKSVVTITTDDMEGSDDEFSINYKRLPKDVHPGEKILLDDGKLELEVIDSNGKDIIKAKVIHGGLLSSHKGVNLPNTKISMPCLTDKDKKDLDFILSESLDWIALSFVRSANDLIELKKIIESKQEKAKVIAKIEKPEAINAIDDIIKESDALMVARGDLGVEIPYQNVPLIQKMLIKKAMIQAKPVIVATQMMESMIVSSTPTRAEVNDAANAVLDGADALMLSAETSVGNYPVEVIQTMTNVVNEMESFDGIYNKEEPPEKNQNRFITDSICFNACRLSRRVSANAILTMSFSGYTAYKIASLRPNTDIFVFTSNKKILTQLSLIWGVKGYYYDKTVSTDHTIADIKFLLKKNGQLNTGDLVINIASMPIEEHGNSNMLKLSFVD